MEIDSLKLLMSELAKLPGIGARSAERIAFHLLRATKEDAMSLAEAIRGLKENVRHCERCFHLTESALCEICSNPRRDQRVVVVVEQPKDLISLEGTGLIQGTYHVLMGHLSPLEGIEPGDLTIDALLDRVKTQEVREVILATNPTVEGDGTALYLHSLLRDHGVQVSRLARGLAVGSQLEYATRAMLEAAIDGRTSM
jgi:recombination protein RecR